MTTSRRVVIILFALSLLAAFNTGSRLYYRLSLIFGLLLLAAWAWSYFALRGLHVVRSARTLRAQVGQIFEERYDLQNLYMLPRLWVEVVDESPLPGSEGSRVLSMIEGKAGRSYLARTRLVQRGVYPLGPTVLSSGDLFGLFPVTSRIETSDSLLVYPMMSNVRNFPHPPGLLPGGEALHRRTHQVTPNAAGVRDYVHGDPLNRIHWMSTARRRRLMVKEFELDPLADVWVFLDAAQYVHAALPTPPQETRLEDFWQKNIRTSLPPATEEYGVSIAASIARDYLRRGRAVGLACVGQQFTVLPPDRGGRQLGKILEALAIVRATGKMPLRGLMEAQARNIARGSTVVIVTTSVQNELAVILDHILQRGLRPVVVLIDAVTFGGHTSADRMVGQVKALGVPLRLVTNGVDLEQALVTAV